MRASFVFSEVFTGLRRNVTMTIAMILTTAISLLMLGIGIFVVLTADKTADQFLGKLEVAVYLNDDVSANDENCTQQPCQVLKQDLEKHPEVESVFFRPQKEAFKLAQELFKNEPELRELIRPQSLPASLHVKLKSPEKTPVIEQDFAERPGVSKVRGDDETVNKLIGWLNSLRNIAFIGSVVLLAAAFMLIANMIQVSAFTRRTEVGIMRLVGATRWYTQLPFLLEAVFAGLIGAVLAVVGLAVLPVFFPDDLATDLSAFQFPDTFAAMLVIAPILILTSAVFSSLVGYVTLRLYVKS